MVHGELVNASVFMGLALAVAFAGGIGLCAYVLRHVLRSESAQRNAAEEAAAIHHGIGEAA